MKFNNHGKILAVGLATAGHTVAQVYKLTDTVPWSPLNTTSVDQSTIYNGTYYLADRVNKGVHVVSLNNNTQQTVVTGFKGLVKANGTNDYAVSGPNGLIVLPDRNELYVGDGEGMVRVIDLFTNAVVASISAGSSNRADEMAYDSKTGTLVVTLPNDKPPKIAIISAADRNVMGTVAFPGASGLEQPAFNSADGKFYISVPSTDVNPGGEIDVVEVSAMNITRTIPLQQCVPAGIVFGPNQNMFVGCSQTQILNYGVAYSQVLDVTSGSVIANISGLAGIDQVTYDPHANYYFASAYQNLAGASKSGAPLPQLGVIDAQNNTLVQTWTTDNVTAHSVAVDPMTDQVVVPLEMFGIAVYNLTSTTVTSSSSPSSSSSANPSGTNQHANSAGTQRLSATTLLGGLLLLTGLFI